MEKKPEKAEAKSLVDVISKPLAIGHEQIGQIQATIGCPGISPVERGTSSIHSPFLKLPKELRQMILKYCVVPGKVFPYPSPEMDPRYEGWEEYGTPSLQLLRVNRKIAEETAEIYHLYNMAVVPRGLAYCSKVDGKFGRGHLSPVMETLTRPAFRRLSIAFSNSDMSLADRLQFERQGRERAKWRHLSASGLGEEPSRESYEERIHESLKTYLFRKIWPCKARMIAANMNLHRLEIDYTDAYCPSGCCRLAASSAIYFGRFEFGLPERIVIQGARSAVEESAILRAITDRHHKCF